jgi:hypothetical protein
MFTDYFIKYTQKIKKSLSAEKNEGKKEKDLAGFKEFYTFMKDHLPAHYTVGSGKIRSKKHFLNRTVDLLIYHKRVPKIEDLSGGYILSEFLYAIMSIENKLNAKNLATHIALTSALKTLYKADKGIVDTEIVRMYSLLFALDSDDSLENIRTALVRVSTEKEVPVNCETDLICVLDKGIIIKNWESGEFRIIETNEDTLMWFYILLLEYLDRDGEVGFDVREYIKNTKEYKVY